MTSPHFPTAGWLAAALLTLGSCLAPVSVCAAEAAAPRSALERLTGEWEGQLRIHALDGFLLGEYPVERSYSWEAGVQIAQTRFAADGQDYITRARQEVLLGRLRCVVHRPGESPEEFQGTAEGGGIVWTDVDRTNRWFKEEIVARGDAAVLQVNGVEIIRLPRVSGLVRVAMELRPKAGRIASPVSRPGESPLADRVEELERLLAETRTAAEAQAGSAAEVARERDALRERLAAAEGRVGQLEATVEELEAAHAQAADRLAELEAAAGAATELAAARGQIESQAKELAEARARLASAADEAAGIERRLAESAAGREALIQQLALAETRERALRAEAGAIADLQEKLEAAVAAREEATENAAGLARENDMLRRDLEAVRAQVAAEEARAAQAGEQLAGSGVVQAAQQAELVQLRRELTDTIAEKDAGQEEARRLARELAAAQLAAQSVDAAHEDLTAARGQIASLEREKATAIRDAESSAAEVARLGARVAELEAGAGQAASLADERDRLAAQLAEVDAARTGFLQRLDEREAALAAAEAARAAAEGRAAGLEEELAATTAPLGELAAARTRATELEGRLAAATASLRELDAIRTRATELESQTTALASVRAELERERHDSAQAQRESERLAAALAAAAAGRDSLAARAAELEASLATALAASQAGGTTRDRLQEEVTRLEGLVAELESERGAAHERAAAADSQTAQAQQLREETMARFQDLIAERNALRDERDRLARANVSLQAEIRAARAAASAPAAAPQPPPVAPSEEPSLFSRLISAVQPGGDAPPQASSAEVQCSIEKLIDGFTIIGITHAAGEDKVILDGRVFRNGEIVDGALGLVFVRIDGDSLLFADADKREYRRKF